jgi:hypothetical protein
MRTPHTPAFVDPEDREPYWTRHYRTVAEAQDEWSEEMAAGAGVESEGAPLTSPSAVVVEPDLPGPARPGSPDAPGVRSRSHTPQEGTA